VVGVLNKKNVRCEGFQCPMTQIKNHSGSFMWVICISPRLACQNHIDLRRIVDEVNAIGSGGTEFVIFLAIKKTRTTACLKQFRHRPRRDVALTAPWHAIPGDHDFKPKSLDNFLCVSRLAGCPI